MERKFKKWLKLVEKKMAKHLPKLLENYNYLDDSEKSLYNDVIECTSGLIDIEQEHHAQLDRIEKKLNYIIEKI